MASDALGMLVTEEFADSAAPEPEEAPGRKRLSRRRLVLRRFLRSKASVFGLVLLTLLVLLAVLGPRLLTDWSYTQLDAGHYREGPTTRHWLGTTQSGRDLFAMMVRGLGKSLIIGLAVALISTTIAAVVGAFAAYFGGWFNAVSLWVIDLLLIIPNFLVIAVVLTTIDAKSSIWVLIAMLGGFGWMLSARIVRSLTLAVKDREYVTAARYMGVSGPRIVFRHILPNISSLLIVDATLAVSGAILAETSLSFFGFGIKSPEVSLGSLIGEGALSATTFPWPFLAGAIPTVLLVLAINFIGDGLRDALDPTSRAGGRA